MNQLTNWWFDQTADIIANHKVSVPDPNAVVATVAEPFLVEVIVRGYITGVTSTALWYRYSLGEREIYGYRFPDGLLKNSKLPEPIITPTTKGNAGAHDERLTCAEVTEKGLLDAATWEQVQAAALTVFKRGQELAQKAGLILVDTKYEFGRIAYAEKGYRGDGGIPPMPADLWVAASQRYIAIYEMLTGKTFEAAEYPLEARLEKNLRIADIIE